MLKYLKFKNYRSFTEEAEIRFAPLTIFVGPNSAGKSSILKLIEILYSKPKSPAFDLENNLPYKNKGLSMSFAIKNEFQIDLFEEALSTDENSIILFSDRTKKEIHYTQFNVSLQDQTWLSFKNPLISGYKFEIIGTTTFFEAPDFDLMMANEIQSGLKPLSMNDQPVIKNARLWPINIELENNGFKWSSVLKDKFLLKEVKTAYNFFQPLICDKVLGVFIGFLYPITMKSTFPHLYSKKRFLFKKSLKKEYFRQSFGISTASENKDLADDWGIEDPDEFESMFPDSFDTIELFSEFYDEIKMKAEKITEELLNNTDLKDKYLKYEKQKHSNWSKSKIVRNYNIKCNYIQYMPDDSDEYDVIELFASYPKVWDDKKLDQYFGALLNRLKAIETAKVELIEHPEKEAYLRSCIRWAIIRFLILARERIGKIRDGYINQIKHTYRKLEGTKYLGAIRNQLLEKQQLWQWQEMNDFIKRIGYLEDSEQDDFRYKYLDTFNKWLAEFGLSYKLVIDDFKTPIGKRYRSVFFEDKERGFKQDFFEVGFGFSQILPVIVEVVLGQIRRQKLLIEQPESQLHPKLQSLLAELFTDGIKNSEQQIIIETHSEYLIRKLQILIAKGHLNYKDVIINYVFKEKNKSSQVKEMKINKTGGFEKPWPSGFFDESVNLSMDFWESGGNV